MKTWEIACLPAYHRRKQRESIYNKTRHPRADRTKCHASRMADFRRGRNLLVQYVSTVFVFRPRHITLRRQRFAMQRVEYVEYVCMYNMV